MLTISSHESPLNGTIFLFPVLFQLLEIVYQNLIFLSKAGVPSTFDTYIESNLILLDIWKIHVNNVSVCLEILQIAVRNVLSHRTKTAK